MDNEGRLFGHPQGFHSLCEGLELAWTAEWL